MFRLVVDGITNEKRQMSCRRICSSIQTEMSRRHDYRRSDLNNRLADHPRSGPGNTQHTGRWLKGHELIVPHSKSKAYLLTEIDGKRFEPETERPVSHG